MTRFPKLFMWTQGLLGGLLAAGLGVAVLALPSDMSIWERLAEQERDEKAIAAATPSMWGFTKSPLPTFQDFPDASRCVRLPSTTERRAEQARLHESYMAQAKAGASAEDLAGNKLLTKLNYEKFWVELRCTSASQEILGRYPSDTDRFTISSPDSWDNRQKTRFHWAVWKWRLKWVGAPLVAIFVGMGTGVVCFRGLLDVFRESSHLRGKTE